MSMSYYCLLLYKVDSEGFSDQGLALQEIDPNYILRTTYS